MNKALLSVLATRVMGIFFLVNVAGTFFVYAADEVAAEINDVQEDVESLELRLEKLEQKVNSPQIRPNLFNPGITAFGNFLTCAGQGYPGGIKGSVGHVHDPCISPFLLRELELDVRASVDPWADAVAILAFEQPEPGTFELEVEEGYFVLKKLPFFNTAPLGLKLKGGRFRVSFGRFNQIHTHDLPQTTIPLSEQRFLGGHGLIRNGLSAQMFIPTPGDNNSLAVTLEILNGGGTNFKPVAKPIWPAGLLRLAWFWDLAPSHDLEVGFSAYAEHEEGRPGNLIQLYGSDINYKWRPYILGDKHSFLWGSEFFVANGVDKKYAAHPMGMFTWTQYQFNQWTYLGVRYDYNQGLTADNTHTVGTFLTYYTTEFLRLRLGYERVMEQSRWAAGRNNVLLEFNFVFGSHPVEPYWVNR